ncbi:DUF2829 domain-containing protein [Bacillus sp. SIMBA_074]|uniref:DUF2829 domain-containing protein n=1 Tax=Bacillus sp. SIMBA_074 TaxID=3085812 RepID=UPI00397E87D7
MTFIRAILALTSGKIVRRKGWNEKDVYLYLIKGSQLSTGLKYGFGEYVGEPRFVDTIAMKTEENTIVVGWLASQTDMLANDWVEL